MEKNTLLNQFNTRMTEFKQSTQHFEEERDMEDVRLLRVVIKKIRALLALTEYMSEKKFRKKHHWDLLKPVFGRAGKLRNIHVNREKSMQARPYCAKPYSMTLEEKEKKADKKLNLKIDNFSFDRLEELNSKATAVMEGYSEEEILSATDKYIAHKLEKVKRLRNETGSDKKLIKIRKHLQAIAELLKLKQDIKPDEEVKSLHQRIKRINDLLGDWHDLYRIMNSIGKHRQKKKARKYIDCLVELHEVFKIKAEEKRANVRKQLMQRLEMGM